MDDCYLFGSALTGEGGLTEAIGRAIMVQALLAGARAVGEAQTSPPAR